MALSHPSKVSCQALPLSSMQWAVQCLWLCPTDITARRGEKKITTYAEGVALCGNRGLTLQPLRWGALLPLQLKNGHLQAVGVLPHPHTQYVDVMAVHAVPEVETGGGACRQHLTGQESAVIEFSWWRCFDEHVLAWEKGSKNQNEHFSLPKANLCASFIAVVRAFALPSTVPPERSEQIRQKGEKQGGFISNWILGVGGWGGGRDKQTSTERHLTDILTHKQVTKSR